MSADDEFAPTVESRFRAFPVRRGSRSPGASQRRTYLCEVFGLGNFHKLGLVEDTLSGRTWCLEADEGANLNGTNLAPSPLFQWLAGIQADVGVRIAALAKTRGIELEALDVAVSQGFASQGSFARGEAVASVFDLDWRVEMRGPKDSFEAEALFDAALTASPAAAMMRAAQPGMFSLQTNGRRTSLDGTLLEWADPSVQEPLRRHSAMPGSTGEPAEEVFRFIAESGDVGPDQELTMGSSGPPVGFRVSASGTLDLQTALMRTRTGVSSWPSYYWDIVCDPTGEQAPAPLALVALGTAFCFHTQLSRYTNIRRLDLRNSSLAQLTTYEPASAAKGVAPPILTGVFLNGGESQDVTRSLLGVAANSCYAHRATSVAVDLASQVTLLAPSVREAG